MDCVCVLKDYHSLMRTTFTNRYSLFSIALILFALTNVTQTNPFLAAFAAGITIASENERVKEQFHRFGEIISELLKLAALLVFGVLISPSFFAEFGFAAYLFILLSLFVVRPCCHWKSH